MVATMSAVEIVIGVAAGLIAILVFGLDIHGRKLEHRSRRERIVIAMLVLTVAAILARVVIHQRRAQEYANARASDNAQTIANPGPPTAAPTTMSDTVEKPAAAPESTVVLTGHKVESPPPKTPPQSDNDAAKHAMNAETQSAEERDPPAPSRNATARDEPSCSEANTGHYGFHNTKTVTVFTVVVYFREGSDDARTITVPPGETQLIYDFPAGRHNFVVSYRAQVPIMTFPPGAPTMPQDVLYRRGEIYVEPCKSGLLDIR